jgi:hypothetical protein
MDAYYETIQCLGGGRFKTCLSDNILDIYQKCEVTEDIALSAQRKTNLTYVSSRSGEIDIDLLSAVRNGSSEFYAVFNDLCEESWHFWRHQTKGETLEDSSQVVYMSLQHSTLLEKVIIELVGDRKAATLLKDALQDVRLAVHLPPVFINILQFIFVPSGLNFRNVIWHGFAAPCEVNRKVCTLLMSLYVTVQLLLRRLEEGRSRAEGARSPAQDHLPLLPKEMFSGFESMTEPFALFDLASLLSGDEGMESTSPLSHLLHSSCFVLPQREQIVLSALVDYSNGNYITSLMKIIPCLEHSLRFLFCLSNHLNAYIMADVDVYYSTLDGFGQRSKHQLLLDPYIFEYDREEGTSHCVGENKLLSVLGEGYYSLLVDLFFAETGPNVRARLAHGINITYDDETAAGATSSTRAITNIVLSLFFAMCNKFYQYTTSERGSEWQQSPCLECVSISDETSSSHSSFCGQLQSYTSLCDQWQSMYHPHRILARLLQEAVTTLHGLAAFTRHRNYICLSRVAATASTNTTGSTNTSTSTSIPYDNGDDSSARTATNSSGLVLILIFHYKAALLDETSSCLQLISQFSDKDSRIFSNFLYDHDAHHASASNFLTVASPGSDTTRRHMKTKSVSTLAHDVIQSCSRLTNSLLTAVISDTEQSTHTHSAHYVPGAALAPAPLALVALLHSLQVWTAPAVQCHECSSACEETAAHRSEEGDCPNIGHFLSLMDQYLKRHCSTFSQPIQGLPCCFSILNVSDSDSMMLCLSLRIASKSFI